MIPFHGINIHGARIVGKVDLNEAKINFPLRLRNCLVADGIDITETEIKELDLSGTSTAGLNGEDCHIEKNVLLTDGFYSRSEVNFGGAYIGGNLECTGGHFVSSNAYCLRFDQARILGNVFLRRTQGKNAATGESDAPFFSEKEVNFAGANISGDFDCSGARMINPDGDALNGERSKVGGAMFFRDDFEANGRIVLIDAEVVGHFNWKKLSPHCVLKVHLESMRIGTLSDDLESYSKCDLLLLDGCSYNRIDGASLNSSRDRLEWLRHGPATSYQPQPYEKLAEIYKSMGHDDEAIRVLIAMNRLHGEFADQLLVSSNEGRSWSFIRIWWARFTSKDWWWYQVFGRFIGYGHRPLRAVVASLVIVTAGWILFYIGYVHCLMWPTSEKSVVVDLRGEPLTWKNRLQVSKDYPRFNSFAYSLEAFIPFVNLGQNSSWQPNASRGTVIGLGRIKFSSGTLLRVYMWVHVIAGWILTTLWLGSFTGLVKG